MYKYFSVFSRRVDGFSLLPSECAGCSFFLLLFTGGDFRHKNCINIRFEGTWRARRLYDFSNNLHDSFFSPHFKEGGYFFLPTFDYICFRGCIFTSRLQWFHNKKKSLSWFWSSAKATSDLLLKAFEWHFHKIVIFGSYNKLSGVFCHWLTRPLADWQHSARKRNIFSE